MITQSWLDALPFGVLVTDTHLRIQQVNVWLAGRLPGGVALVGQLMPAAFPELVECGLLGAFDLLWQEARALTLPNDVYGHFLSLPAQPGTDLEFMPQTVTLAPLKDGGVITGALIVVEDVTQRLLTKRQLEREIDKLSALHELDRALATLDLHACLQAVVERTRLLFAAESSALFLVDGDRLVASAVTGGPLDDVGLTLPLDKGIVGWTATHRQPILAPDVASDSRYLAYNRDSRSEMAAPLLLHGECLGVINVESNRASAFDGPDLETLAWLGARAAAAIHNARLHAAEREQRTLADTLRNIGLSLAAELNPDAILDTLLDHVAQVVPYDTAAVMMVEARTGRVRIARQRGYERFGVLHLVSEFDVPLTSFPNLSIMARDMRPQVVPYVRTFPDWRPGALSAHIESWAGAPVIARGQLIGFLSLDKVDPGFYRLELAERLAAFAAQAGLALENARLYAEQQKLAVTDGLTGLANRRYLDQELTRELQRASRFDRSTALIMLDLDNFKDYNDHHGHPAGDELLRALALLLSHSVRTIDTVARYGGEEFALILPESDTAAACTTAERVRDLVARQLRLPAVAHAGSVVTISLGVALAPAHGATPARLLQTADEALYAAKRAGKNRVMLSDGLAMPIPWPAAPAVDRQPAKDKE